MQREAEYRNYFVFQAAVQRTLASRVVVLKNLEYCRKISVEKSCINWIAGLL